MNLKIGLIDVDGHHFPNLCLMKLSAYHKARGDTVEWHDGRKKYDLVYMSRVFTDTYTKDFTGGIHADCIIKGGTGYGLKNKLRRKWSIVIPIMACIRSFQIRLMVSCHGGVPVAAASASWEKKREEKQRQ